MRIVAIMIKRRRILTIIAGGASLPILGARAKTNIKQWRGTALGAELNIILEHENSSILIEQAIGEIKRLENIFSLYRQDSELSLLNREGKLSNPSFEFLELLSICAQINFRTKGAFDPSVQPLWALYARQYANSRGVKETQIRKIKNIIGWKYVNYSSAEIKFAKRGMALTLNGIAQGYIADKVRELFIFAGVENSLINTGEIASIGIAPNGQNWQIKIKNSDKQINLSPNGAAIATSASLGTYFDKEAKIGHIIDPRNGKPANIWQQVSVISKSAALADGLSTGFSLLNRAQIMENSSDIEVLLV